MIFRGIKLYPCSLHTHTHFFAINNWRRKNKNNKSIRIIWLVCLYPLLLIICCYFLNSTLITFEFALRFTFISFFLHIWLPFLCFFFIFFYFTLYCTPCTWIQLHYIYIFSSYFYCAIFAVVVFYSKLSFSHFS